LTVIFEDIQSNQLYLITMHCLPTHLSIILSKGQALNSKH